MLVFVPELEQWHHDKAAIPSRGPVPLRPDHICIKTRMLHWRVTVQDFKSGLVVAFVLDPGVMTIQLKLT